MRYSDPATKAAGLHSITTIEGRQQTPKPRKLEIQDDELSEAVSMLGFQVRKGRGEMEWVVKLWVLLFVPVKR
jgi:hypothetical protein